MIWVFVLAALAVGAMLPFQAGINAQLAEYLGSPLRAAPVSVLVSVLVPLLLVAVFRSRFADRGTRERRSLVGVARRRARHLLRRELDHIRAQAGRSTLIGVILAGQAAASLAVDHFGMVASTSIRRHSGGWPACS